MCWLIEIHSSPTIGFYNLEFHLIFKYFKFNFSERYKFKYNIKRYQVLYNLVVIKESCDGGD